MENTSLEKAIYFAIDRIRKQKHQRPHRDNIVKFAVDQYGLDEKKPETTSNSSLKVVLYTTSRIHMVRTRTLFSIQKSLVTVKMMILTVMFLVAI